MGMRKMVKDKKKLVSWLCRVTPPRTALPSLRNYLKRELSSRAKPRDLALSVLQAPNGEIPQFPLPAQGSLGMTG